MFREGHRVMWTAPPATDAQFRAAGFTAAARAFPHSEAGARWIAAFNNVPFDRIPAAWCYASSAWMRDYVEALAGGGV
jgi:hypothetical protein